MIYGFAFKAREYWVLLIIINLGKNITLNIIQTQQTHIGSKAMKTLIAFLGTTLGKTIAVLMYIAVFAIWYFDLKSADTEAWMLEKGYLHGTFAYLFLFGLILGATSGFLFGRLLSKQSYQHNTGLRKNVLKIN
jgi:hypothetical protein